MANDSLDLLSVFTAEGSLVRGSVASPGFASALASAQPVEDDSDVEAEVEGDLPSLSDMMGALSDHDWM